VSYILDALKKSEAERRAAAPVGGVGGAVYVVDAAPAFTGWRPLGVAALVLAVAGVVVLWRSGERSEAIAVAAAPPAQAPASPLATPELPVEAKPRLPAELPAELPKVAPPPPAEDPGLVQRDIPGRAPPAVRTPAEVRDRMAGDARDRAAREQTVRPRPARVAPRPATPAPPAVAGPLPAQSPAVSAAVVSRTAGVAARGANVSPAPATPEAVLVTASLPPPLPVGAPAAAPTAPTAGAVAVNPPPVRETTAPGNGAPAVAGAGELPRLVVSGFAGGEDRDARFAVINDRIVREGEEFAPDLRLTHVGPDGVIVEYRGTRYRP